MFASTLCREKRRPESLPYVSDGSQDSRPRPLAIPTMLGSLVPSNTPTHTAIACPQVTDGDLGSARTVEEGICIPAHCLPPLAIGPGLALSGCH